MDTPVLQTERLILRPLNIEDSEEVYKNWTSDPVVGKFMRWPLHKTVNVTRAWLEFEEKNVSSDKEYNFGFVLKEKNIIVGSGGLVLRKNDNIYELGYNLMQDCWGKGIAYEACTEILKFAKEKLNLKQIFVCHATSNIRSENLIKRLGGIFIKEGKDSNFDGSKHFITKEYIIKL